jgi:transcriptional regulator with XRE-family HTH domain
LTPQKKNIIGERVRLARLQAKPPITQEQLAARLQVEGFGYIDQAKISRIENGARPVQDYELLALSEALNVTPNWLLSAEE